MNRTRMDVQQIRNNLGKLRMRERRADHARLTMMQAGHRIE